MSIQQRIASDIYSMANKAVTPDQIKALQAHLVRGVQDGSVPSYVGVPLLADLNQKMAKIQTAPAQARSMVQQPPIAQQVMSQAEQGVATLPSNLPEEGMAGGGIVAFADGGMSNYNVAEHLLSDEDDDEADFVRQLMASMQGGESGADEEDMDALAATKARESIMTKQAGQPARGVTRERTSISGPAGLESLLKMIEQKESGGRDYDKYGNLLTSSAGAQGRMQVMPGTSRDPGFGIRPAKEGDVEDLARVGKEYFAKMLERYGDPKTAAIAYNWGPGNTDKWLASGAGIDALPRETQKYIVGMREGGVAHFEGGGLSDIFGMSGDEIKDAMRRRLRMEQARDAFSRAPAAAAPAAAAESAGLPSLMDSIKSGFSRLNPRGVTGWGLATYSPELNVGEEAELAKRWAGTAGAGRGMAPASSYNVPAAQAATRQPSVQQTAEENPYTAGQDVQDMLAGSSTQDLSQPAQMPTEAAAAAAPAAGGAEAGIRAYLDKMREGVGKQRDIDNYLSLLSAGLGMMGGTSPYAAANIGAGAQQGIRTYQQAAQLRGADERALLSGELGLEKYKLLKEAQKEAAQSRRESASEVADIRRARLQQAERKMYADQLQNMIETAQKQALAEYKGELIGDKKEQIFAQAEAKLQRTPEYRQLYKQVYGRDPFGGEGWGIREIGGKK